MPRKFTSSTFFAKCGAGLAGGPGVSVWQIRPRVGLDAWKYSTPVGLSRLHSSLAPRWTLQETYPVNRSTTARCPCVT